MSCRRNCNTHSWKGDKGDPGAPGAPGINGINGIYQLANIITPVNNQTTGVETLMSYNLVQSNVSLTPFQNSDILRIEARLNSDGLNTQKTIGFVFGGTQLLVFAGMFGYNQSRLVINMNITRIDSTHIYVEAFIENFNGFVTSTWRGSYYSNSIPVANLDSNDTLLELTGDGDAIGDITAQYLRIKLEKHP